MQSYKPLLFPVVFLCMMNMVKAQVSDTIPAQIEPLVDSNRVKFTAVLRPLRQIAGAPAAFYTYFWEFGDGTYSFEKEPVHHYADTGDYAIRLFATNNYDDGKKPPTRLKRVRLEKKKTMIAANTMPSFFKGNGSLEIKSNQMPKPGEDMVLLIGYRNKPGTGNAAVSGSIMLLYNEKQFSQNSFDIAEARTYHEEKTIGFDSLVAYAPADPGAFIVRKAARGGLFEVSGEEYEPIADKQSLVQLLKQEMATFRKHDIWRINAVKPGEEKFMFLSINTLPEMIKDTNAVVTISGLFVPDNPEIETEKFNLELQIVASHDPNRIMLKNKRLNYRFTGKNRDNVYKVQFQNTGKGPAKTVAITITIPDMLNTASVSLVDMKPQCTWCTTAYPNQSCIDTVVTNDSIRFIFKNIYLPGTQQDGVNDPDSTMGFVKYKLNFDKKMKKLPFTSRASIVFDKNEPIYTNRSVGRFKRGLSPGIIIGYGMALGSSIKDIAKQNYTIGFTISEYAAYRKYFQWELYLQGYKEYEQFMGRRTGGDTILNGVAYKLEYSDIYKKEKVFAFEAVPLEFRYNLSSFASAGAGALVAGEFNRTTKRIIRAQAIQNNPPRTISLEGEQGKRSESFAEWRGALFADIQLGRVRVGPAVGVRFLQYFNPSHQRILFYASWKI